MEYQWPYKNEYGQTETVEADVLVLGGGLAGCFAAISAARKGKKVILVEKGATKRSGSAGTGFPCVFSRKIFWKAAKESLFWGRSILAENC